ncbi:uncharacterized protein N7477_008869 [Penicillium maclennaniae]|uniref:uncharacterized protein n=1 Tax=Penicillium maclennaniae TaxID=1343394 RepID=UPI002541E7D2|nr:uncharacterized protein N7477_008869 [Penicillium maclennaniae]KAJ5666421.1 hypothetical protein N7477_008869 [Penicillium maclennaniae]
MTSRDNKTHDFTRDAANTVRVFRRTFPGFLASFEALLDPLIRYFVHTFRLNMNPNLLPITAHLETPSQQYLRCSIVSKLMADFNSSEPFQFDRDYDHDIFTFVVYWYLRDSWAAVIREQIARHTPRTDLGSFAGFSYFPKPVSKELRPSLFIYNLHHPDLGDIHAERNGLYYVGRREWIDGRCH